MKYTLVKPDGTLGASQDFTVIPLALAPNKGRWLPDNPPAFNPATHTRTKVAVQDVGATEIAYLIEPRPLAEVQLEKVYELQQFRDAETVLDVMAHGRPWQADDRSQKLLSSAITLALAGAPLPAAWRDSANNNMAITSIADLMQIAGAMAVQTQTAYIKSWTLKAQVEAATAVEGVAAITW